MLVFTLGLYDYGRPPSQQSTTPIILRPSAFTEVHIGTLIGFPLLQVEGGFVQGMGWTCLEELVWGDEDHKWLPPGVLHTRGPGGYPDCLPASTIKAALHALPVCDCNFKQDPLTFSVAERQLPDTCGCGIAALSIYAIVL